MGQSLLYAAARATIYSAIFRIAAGSTTAVRKASLSGLAIALLAFAHSSLTLSFFMGAEFTLSVFILCIGFVMLTVGSIELWVSAPTPASVFVLTIWLVILWRAVHTGIASLSMVLVLGSFIGAVAWITVHSLRSQYRPMLDKSDEVESLMEKLTGANAHLHQVRMDLSATLDRRSTFFANASHDLRQRLHAIKLLAFTTLIGMPREHAGYRALRKLSAEVDELEQYFTDVLDFARIEALGSRAELRSVPLATLFQKLDLVFETPAASRGVELRFRATSAQILTDTAMMQRILENLISNALKFTRGRVLIAARSRSRSRSRTVLIEVWDQGPGIPEQAFGRIFEAFYEGGPASDDTRGIGLGLAIVRHFAERVGCTVTVRSSIDKASVFRLQVPAA